MRWDQGSPLSDPVTGMGPIAKSHHKLPINGHSRPADIATLPLANGYAEAPIGSASDGSALTTICSYSASPLSHILLSYMNSHNEVRTIYLLEKDRQSRAPLIGQAVFFAASILAGYTPVCPDLISTAQGQATSTPRAIWASPSNPPLGPS